MLIFNERISDNVLEGHLINLRVADVIQSITLAQISGPKDGLTTL